MCSRQEIVAIAHKLFDDYDADGSGNINRSQLKTIFDTLFTQIAKTKKVDQTRLNKIFTVADVNSDNKLTFKQFLKIVDDFLELSF